MPWGLKRYYGSQDLHFITFSCYKRDPLLGTPQRRDLLLQVLEQVRRRYRFVVLGYVVMPEHVHLLISEPQERAPSIALQALKLGFARRVLGAQKRERDPLQADVLLDAHRPWEHRFYDFNVWTEAKRIEKPRYIHRNSVKRGFVESPEMWAWSSYRAYAFSEPGPVRVNDWTVLEMKVREVLPVPTSRNSRDVGHPQSQNCERRGQSLVGQDQRSYSTHRKGPGLTTSNRNLQKWKNT